MLIANCQKCLLSDVLKRGVLSHRILVVYNIYLMRSSHLNIGTNIISGILQVNNSKDLNNCAMSKILFEPEERLVKMYD